MTEPINDDYTTFAAQYDALFDPELYQDWAAYVERLSQPSKMLDLAGGAGRLAVLLAQQGYQVDLLDLSPDMLALAQKHAQAADVDLRLLEGDMRDFSDWTERYPLIVSFADSLNYLPSKPDLMAALEQVYEHLEEGGRFLFDVITPYQVEVGYDNYYYNNDDDPENIFMWTSFPGENKNSVDHDLKFFVYDEELDAFKLLREVHHEQTYTLKDYLKCLKKVGFKDVKVSADFGRAAADDEADRWFFEARKG
ncbi:class I SAM-dependent DNA methyltransferase [Eupransor demetentiae]|uniref:Ubiquinone/menaquinone biosynthesis C-methylase UbiE/MenG (UbiE) n=1 Tax=Eupransor demetentiae TaxID=3109584 RepID=A0ABP0ETF7_9LACO|nr:Ubiquinone/menaquinone biosynthesis C-methylase UbiE/MenG (UbiE) [Lactobacillaceae bacterium LMG 33000]